MTPCIGYIINIPNGMDLTQLRRAAGFLLWTDSATMSAEARRNMLETADVMHERLELKCPRCKTDITFKVQNLRRFYYDSSVRCRKCKTLVQFTERTERKISRYRGQTKG